MGQRTEPHRWEESRGTGGEGERERAVKRERESWRVEKRATILQTSFCFPFDLCSGDPVASMKPAFVSIDFLPCSGSAH